MAQKGEQIQFYKEDATEELIFEEMRELCFDDSMKEFDPDFPDFSKKFKITITVEEIPACPANVENS